MIDLHNHVLYGADDGAQNIDESIEMLKEAARVGFTGAVLTPHYMLHKGYTNHVDINTEAFNTLKSAFADVNADFKLYLGSELYFDYRLTGLIGTGAFTTMGKSGYYLVETGRNGGSALGLQNFMLKLRQAGGKTILAHPERYDFVQDDPNILLEFLEQGTLIQSNYLSLTDYYGKATRKTMEILLKHDMVQLMGSDAHQKEGYALYPEAKAAGEALIGAEKWNEIMSVNSHKLIEGTGDIAVKPKYYKKALSKSVIARYAL